MTSSNSKISENAIVPEQRVPKNNQISAVVSRDLKSNLREMLVEKWRMSHKKASPGSLTSSQSLE